MDRPPGLDRVLGRLGERDDLVGRLAALGGADLTSLLMAVAAERADRVDAAAVLRQYGRDRFVRPSPHGVRSLRAPEDAFLRAAAGEWEWMTLAPVVPFGAHTALGDLSENRVLAALRAVEVAADPTVALALEAAVRRRPTERRRTGPTVRVASIQRVIRAQRFADPDAWSHFHVVGLVTAGRSRPRDGFDAPAFLEHLRVHVRALAGLSADEIRIVVSRSPDESGAALLTSVREGFEGSAGVRVVEDPERAARQRYYQRACFKVHATLRGATFEVADGGFTDWTARLLADRRERAMISGAGLDRIALALS